MTVSAAVSTLHAGLEPGKPPLLRVEPGVDAARWAAEHRQELCAFVADHGSLLVRGLGLRDAARAEAVFRQLGDLTLETEAFAPRGHYAQGVYTASKWPPNQPMCMHHELSYALAVPRLMLFACVAPPAAGGATPVADAAAVPEALPPDLVDRFERQGWLLIRNYNDDIGASFADAFGTDDRNAIESYCRAHDIRFEWQDGGGGGGGALRTWQRRRAIVPHPLTRRLCWFNQIAFLSEWTMAPELRDYLVDVYGADRLLFNTAFGNGAPIGADVVQVINEVYEAHTVREPWQAGDLLVVDNVRAAHGREPFEGPREVVVALAQ